MKKLFYIVLVIVVLLVISRFIKNSNETVPTAEPAVVAEEVVVDENAKGEPIAVEDVVVAEPDADVDAGEEVDGTIVETNPEATQDEDETIVSE